MDKIAHKCTDEETKAFSVQVIVRSLNWEEAELGLKRKQSSVKVSPHCPPAAQFFISTFIQTQFMLDTVLGAGDTKESNFSPWEAAEGERCEQITVAVC